MWEGWGKHEQTSIGDEIHVPHEPPPHTHRLPSVSSRYIERDFLSFVFFALVTFIVKWYLEAFFEDLNSFVFGHFPRVSISVAPDMWSPELHPQIADHNKITK